MPKKMLFAMAGAVLLLTGSFAWNAEATALSGVGTLQTAVKDYSPVEPAVCWCGPFRCRCSHWRYWGPYHHRHCWWRHGVRYCRW
jgi:hypothetical protein